MCGGAILAELIPSTPARRVTPGHLWPAAKQQRADDFEAAFREFDGDSDEEVQSKPLGFNASSAGAATRKLRRQQRCAASGVKHESETSESGGALPDFSWQGVSAYDEAPAPVAVEAEDQSGASKRPRTEPESTDEASPRASESESDALFDAFLFGDQLAYFNGGAYESLDSLFSADAVQSNDAADEGMGLWSFDDSCLVEDNLSF